MSLLVSGKFVAYGKREHEKDDAFIDVLGVGHFTLLLLAQIGEASTCLLERRNTKHEEGGGEG